MVSKRENMLTSKTELDIQKKENNQEDNKVVEIENLDFSFITPTIN